MFRTKDKNHPFELFRGFPFFESQEEIANLNVLKRYQTIIVGRAMSGFIFAEVKDKTKLVLVEPDRRNQEFGKKHFKKATWVSQDIRNLKKTHYRGISLGRTMLITPLISIASSPWQAREEGFGPLLYSGVHQEYRWIEHIMRNVPEYVDVFFIVQRQAMDIGALTKFRLETSICLTLEEQLTECVILRAKNN